MKIRVTHCNSLGYPKWIVQQRKWWGWKTIYSTSISRYITEFINELKQYRDLEIIRK